MLIRLFALAALLGVPAWVCSAEPPTSDSAKKARAAYDAGIKKLDEEYQRKLAELRDQYVKGLEEARTGALAKKDLEEAQRVLAAQKEATGEAAASATLQIEAAYYGWNTKWVNVTPVVRREVGKGQLVIASGTFEKLFGDPAFKEHKTLVVVYRQKGLIGVSIAGSGQVLRAPSPR